MTGSQIILSQKTNRSSLPQADAGRIRCSDDTLLHSRSFLPFGTHATLEGNGYTAFVLSGGPNPASPSKKLAQFYASRVVPKWAKSVIFVHLFG